MNTTDGMWVPSYYRRRHPFLWVRAAGGPQRVDWIVGVVLAVLVLSLIAHSRTPPRQTVPSVAVAAAATTAAQDSDIGSGRVAYVPSTANK